MSWTIIKVILPAILTFGIGILITFPVSNFLYKHKLWKKKSGKVDMRGEETPVYNKLYEKRDKGTPRMGGAIIWLSVLILVFVFWFLSRILPNEIFIRLDFLSRDQTWIPLAALFVGAIVGLLDDYLEIFSTRNIKNITGGLSFKKRLLLTGMIATFVSGWFYFKLDVQSVGVPFVGDLHVGILIMPIFIILTLLIYGGGVIDGLDGLAGGVFAIMFSSYGLIAYSLNQINLAAFCAAIVGGTLAFLWFNIPPARFYMSETGTMALTITISIVAFMTDSIVGGIGLFVLPIIAFPLVISIVTSVLQIFSKKYFNGKKILIAAPLHHHLEAIGWPPEKVVMRYWVLTIMLSGSAIILTLLV